MSAEGAKRMARSAHTLAVSGRESDARVYRCPSGAGAGRRLSTTTRPFSNSAAACASASMASTASGSVIAKTRSLSSTSNAQMYISLVR